MNSFWEVEEEVVTMLHKITHLSRVKETLRAVKEKLAAHMRKGDYTSMRYHICCLLPFPWPCVRLTLTGREG